jgi:hypothetical protein
MNRDRAEPDRRTAPSRAADRTPSSNDRAASNVPAATSVERASVWRGTHQCLHVKSCRSRGADGTERAHIRTRASVYAVQAWCPGRIRTCRCSCSKTLRLTCGSVAVQRVSASKPSCVSLGIHLQLRDRLEFSAVQSIANCVELDRIRNFVVRSHVKQFLGHPVGCVGESGARCIAHVLGRIDRRSSCARCIGDAPSPGGGPTSSRVGRLSPVTTFCPAGDNQLMTACHQPVEAFRAVSIFTR